MNEKKRICQRCRLFVEPGWDVERYQKNAFIIKSIFIHTVLGTIWDIETRDSSEVDLVLCDGCWIDFDDFMNVYSDRKKAVDAEIDEIVSGGHAFGAVPHLTMCGLWTVEVEVPRQYQDYVPPRRGKTYNDKNVTCKQCLERLY